MAPLKTGTQDIYTPLALPPAGRSATVTPMGAEKHKPRRNLTVDFLIVIFGVSSWVAVNGLWVELPVLVNKLPESWELASYIVITSQIANLGPILFGAARRIWSQKLLEVPIIHTSLGVVITACVLLSIFWDTTTVLFGELHSTALLVLAFFLSFVDCTSSLLYLPFIANFKEQYVISYMVGSGLSGPVPGVIAMAQGVGGYADCRNVTVNTTTENGTSTDYVLQPYYPPPRFSPNIFFGILSAQMCISWIAFVLLNSLPQAKRERKQRVGYFGTDLLIPNHDHLTRPTPELAHGQHFSMSHQWEAVRRTTADLTCIRLTHNAYSLIELGFEHLTFRSRLYYCWCHVDKTT
ncbi:Solute carrier family 52, riboflavin transporter, member 3-A [Araneus ventricosus]|uniref:Riboflavin transporter n=1 Tax=Araneus ventricosus TaxID=182803 RepID=A0A4Y2JAM4_ARAVE|nr:Solute carrier family 52, riboflavin transporter, member 3-A [Araneus ventricosus]